LVDLGIEYYTESTNLKEFVKDKVDFGLKEIVKKIATEGKSADETARNLINKYTYFNWNVIFYSSKITGYACRKYLLHKNYLMKFR